VIRLQQSHSVGPEVSSLEKLLFCIASELDVTRKGADMLVSEEASARGEFITLLEEMYESIAHRHLISHPEAEKEGRVILTRLHELLDMNGADEQDALSTERYLDNEAD
jgi:hypothetical protein